MTTIIGSAVPAAMASSAIWRMLPFSAQSPW